MRLCSTIVASNNYRRCKRFQDRTCRNIQEWLGRCLQLHLLRARQGRHGGVFRRLPHRSISHAGASRRGRIRRVLPFTVLECGTPGFRGIIRVAGHVHTHPKPAEGMHNDFPSYKGPGNNGDVLLHTLLGYPEVYVIPYTSCCGIEVIVLSDRSTWCPNH